MALVKSLCNFCFLLRTNCVKLLLHSQPLARSISKTATASAMSHSKSSKTFSFSDYDVIGFDLDYTLLRYNLSEIVPLEYFNIAKFLVEKRDYPRKLLEPIGADIDLMQKGLIFDIEKGNTLKIGPTGRILKAAHGSKFLTESQIVEEYGPEQQWSVTTQFIKDPLSTWNGPLSEKMRTLLDYFDMPASLAFARSVDALDSQKGGRLQKYEVYADILASLIEIYKRESFSEGTSEYFEALKKDPQRYILKASPSVLSWLKELKATKTTYLLTGSNTDFVNLTASTAFGPDWRDLFDIVVCYARKPGFFVANNRPFFAVDGVKEVAKIENNQLELNKTYTQGSWKVLEKFLQQKSQKFYPKCVYVGDNLIQDIYTPVEHTQMDTVCVSEELLAEAGDKNYPFSEIITSESWGSYFAVGKEITLWSSIIQNQPKLYAPTVDYFASNPINYKYSTNVHTSKFEPPCLCHRKT